MIPQTPDKYINPLIDYGFRKLFGEPKNKNLSIAFLNELLPDKHKIKALTFSKSLGNSGIQHLYCFSKKNKKFIIILQKAELNFFKNESNYFASFFPSSKPLTETWNDDQIPIYAIGILDFIFPCNRVNKQFLHVNFPKNQTKEVMFIYVELPKFNKTLKEVKNDFEKWLFVFKHLPKLSAPPKQLSETIFQELFKAAMFIRLTDTEQQAYLQSLKYYRDMKNIAATAYQAGFQKGQKKA